MIHMHTVQYLMNAVTVVMNSLGQPDTPVSVKCDGSGNKKSRGEAAKLVADKGQDCKVKMSRGCHFREVAVAKILFIQGFLATEIFGPQWSAAACWALAIR